MICIRNIVHIIFDCLRADHCSFMGYHRETTPTLDKMARKGIVFENAIAHSIATLPSVTGLITGTYPLCDSNSNKRSDWIRELKRCIPLAQKLKNMGYHTAAFQPNPRLSKYYGINKGFDFYQDFININKDVNIKKSSLIDEIRKFIKKEAGYIIWEKFYDEILCWKEKAKKPYYLWILLMDTHGPYSTTPKSEKIWCKKSNLYLDMLRLKRYKLELNKKEKRIYVDAYDDSIHYADKFLHRLIRDFSDDDPVFIIHADHGEELWDHGDYGHIDVLKLYEELIHIPLVIYNFDQKEVFDKPTLLFELRSIILNNIATCNKIDCNKYFGDDIVISKIFDGGVRKIAIRSKEWKYIAYNNNKELYNLLEDPKEHINLINYHGNNILNVTKKFEYIAKKHIKKELEIRSIRKITKNI